MGLLYIILNRPYARTSIPTIKHKINITVTMELVMPFVRCELSESTSSQIYENRGSATPEQPGEIPLYLVTDIFENPYTFQSLAEQLHKVTQGRPIYIYMSDITLPDQHDAYTLENEAELIVKELQSVVPYNQAPYALIAFSKGCTIAAKAAKILEQHGQDAYLFLIDGPTPEVAKQYILQPSANLTKDIYNMVYTAKSLAGITTFKESENQDPSQLINLSMIDALKLAASRITDLDFPSSKEEVEFIRYIKLVERWFYHLARHSLSVPSPYLSCQAAVVLTNATKEKYCTRDGGWAKYTPALTLIEDNLLAGVDHLSLMNNEYCATRLAQYIMAFINSQPVFTQSDQLTYYKIATAYGYILDHCKRSGVTTSNPAMAAIIHGLEPIVETARRSSKTPSSTLSLSPTDSASASQQDDALVNSMPNHLDSLAAAHAAAIQTVLNPTARDITKSPSPASSSSPNHSTGSTPNTSPSSSQTEEDIRRQLQQLPPNEQEAILRSLSPALRPQQESSMSNLDHIADFTMVERNGWGSGSCLFGIFAPNAVEVNAAEERAALIKSASTPILPAAAASPNRR